MNVRQAWWEANEEKYNFAHKPQDFTVIFFLRIIFPVIWKHSLQDIYSIYQLPSLGDKVISKCWDTTDHMLKYTRAWPSLGILFPFDTWSPCMNCVTPLPAIAVFTMAQVGYLAVSNYKYNLQSFRCLRTNCDERFHAIHFFIGVSGAVYKVRKAQVVQGFLCHK